MQIGCGQLFVLRVWTGVYSRDGRSEGLARKPQSQKPLKDLTVIRVDIKGHYGA
jgi:hypothetical protein